MFRKITKKKAMLGSATGLVVTAFALAWGLPAVLATSTIVGYSTGGDVTLNGSSTGEATVSVTALADGIIDDAEGVFATSESGDSSYFALTSIEPVDSIELFTNVNPATGDFMFQESRRGVNFSAGATLLTAKYSVDASTPAGTYHLPVYIKAVSRDANTKESKIDLDAAITVVRNDPVTEISIAGATVRNKTYDGTTAATVDGVTFEGATLSADDYTVTAVFDDANVGERKATVTVELTGEAAKRYELTNNTFETTANISIAELSEVSATIPMQRYTGSALTPEVTVTATLNGEQVTLVKDVDYSLNYGEVIDAGNHMVTISAPASGSNYHFTEFTETFVVAKKIVTVEAMEVADKVYDGTTAAKANVTLSDGLTQDTDYAVTVTFDSANVGDRTTSTTVTLSDTAYKNYCFEEGAQFAEVSGVAKITPLTLTGMNVNIPTQEYTGSVLMPEVTVTAPFGESTITLVEGTDYTLDYETSVTNVRNYAVTVKPVEGSNYTFDKKSENFTITAHELTAADVTLEYTMVRYDDSEQKPAVTVKIGENTISADNYTVTYAADVTSVNNSVAVKVEGDLNLTGTVEKTYAIVDKDVLTISGISDQTVAYTGSEVELVGDLTVSGTNSITGEDYDIAASALTTTWYGADGNELTAAPIDAGTYKVVYGYEDANCVGELSVNVTIEKAVSPQPAEMTAGLAVEAGRSLSDIDGTRTAGFEWSEATDLVAAGAANYGATYTYNNDTANYTTLDLAVPVYGLTRINVGVLIDGDGGTVEASAYSVLEGDEVTITATSDEGYTLISLLVNGVERVGDVVNNTLTLTAGTDDLVVIAKFVPVYEVIEGAEQTYTVGDDGATFRIDADYSLFENGGEVYVDGVLVDPSNYTSWDGSTYIKFSADYMNTLAAGTHTLAVVFNNGGVATTNFTVAEAASASESMDSATNSTAAPETGAFTGSTGGAVAGGVVVAAAVAGAAFYAGRKIAKRK